MGPNIPKPLEHRLRGGHSSCTQDTSVPVGHLFGSRGAASSITQLHANTLHFIWAGEIFQIEQRVK